MPTRNVELNEHFEEFIQAGVSSGRFRDANEIVRAGLQLLETQEQEERTKLEWLRGAAKEGFDAIERGELTRVSSPSEVTAFVRGIASKESRPAK